MERSEELPAGFSLVEVLVSVVLLALLAGSLAPLTTRAMLVVLRSRAETAAVLAAGSRLDHLRSLEWGYGAAASPSAGSDYTTDTATPDSPPTGSGLTPSGSGALESDTAGYVDYLDRDGRWLGRDAGLRGSARFVRRWSVESLGGRPDLLLLRVRVVDLRGLVPDVGLFTFKTRTAV